MRRGTLLLGLALGAFTVGGCFLYDESRIRGGAGTAEFCDSTGCYLCDDNGECWLTAVDCASDGDCMHGCFCDLASGYCVETSLCEADADCNRGFVCNTASETCVPSNVPPPKVCTADDQCPPSSYCSRSRGKCIETGFCDQSSDCGPGQVCDPRNTCVPSSLPPGTCTVNDDCGLGEYC